MRDGWMVLCLLNGSRNSCYFLFFFSFGVDFPCESVLGTNIVRTDTYEVNGGILFLFFCYRDNFFCFPGRFCFSSLCIRFSWFKCSGFVRYIFGY